MGRIRQGVTLEYLSLAWMGVEVVGSIGIGLLSMSFALLAFGSDSVVEMVSAFVVTLHLKSDSSGSDGLGDKAEAATKFLLIALIPIIGGGALYSYLAGIEPESSLLGIAVALGAVIIMPVLWVRKRRIGRETNCAPLSMDAVQSATCFLMSLALLGGLVINYLFGIGWMDYVAAGVILAFVAKEGIEAFRVPLTPPATDAQSNQLREQRESSESGQTKPILGLFSTGLIGLDLSSARSKVGLPILAIIKLCLLV
ncbi:MAG: cation transporter [Nitrososphaerales archaeon]|jgi:divalent metal cation (Fe/Co/Zn/Cd) transporter